MIWFDDEDECVVFEEPKFIYGEGEKEAAMKLTEAVKIISDETGIPESQLWEASSAVFPTITMLNADIPSVRMNHLRMELELKLKEAPMPEATNSRTRMNLSQNSKGLFQLDVTSEYDTPERAAEELGKAIDLAKKTCTEKGIKLVDSAA